MLWNDCFLFRTRYKRLFAVVFTQKIRCQKLLCRLQCNFHHCTKSLAQTRVLFLFEILFLFFGQSIQIEPRKTRRKKRKTTFRKIPNVWNVKHLFFTLRKSSWSENFFPAFWLPLTNSLHDALMCNVYTYFKSFFVYGDDC